MTQVGVFLRAAVTKYHELGDLNNRRGFPGSSVVKNPADAGDVGLIPELGRSSGEGNGNPSSILAGEIPWTGSLVGYIQSTGSQRVGHNLATNQQQHLQVKC